MACHPSGGVGHHVAGSELRSKAKQSFVAKAKTSCREENDHEAQRDPTIADGGGRCHDAGRAGRCSGARQVSVSAELDAVWRARAFLRGAGQGVLQGSRPRRRDPRRQRLDHGRAVDRQRHQPGLLCRCGDHDARHQCRHADQGRRRDAAAEPDVVHLPCGQSAAEQDIRNQGQPDCHHRRRRQPCDLHRFHGQARHEGQ